MKVGPLTPPPPATGHAHPDCYLSSPKDCSKGISREHYVSQDILLEFGQLAVSGFLWQPTGEVLRLGTNALAAKVLCDRHNSALSDLDSFALVAFRAFVGAPRYVTSRLNPGRAMHYLVSGQALEFWMVKLLAGIVAGGIASDSRRPLRRSRGDYGDRGVRRGAPMPRVIDAIGGRRPVGHPLYPRSPAIAMRGSAAREGLDSHADLLPARCPMGQAQVSF